MPGALALLLGSASAIGPTAAGNPSSTREVKIGVPAAQKAGIAGWTYPADDDSVRKCLEELRIGPFRPSVTVTLAATVRTYWPWLLGTALALAAMIAVIAGFARMNRRLVVAQKQLQRLSRAVEQSPASIVITDRQGAVEYVNPGFVSRTGYAVEEALGENPRILKSGVQPCEFYEQMWKVLLRREVWRGEICNRKKNGDLYWEDATIAPVLDAHGTITDFVAVKVDISERKRAEEALKAAKEPRPAPSPDGPVPLLACPAVPPIDGGALLARCVGDLEFAVDLLSDFAGDLAQRVEKIARHARQGDARATAESAHALKGTAGMMSAGALQTLAARIEAAGGDGDLAQAASLADELRGEVQRCLRYLPELREKMTDWKGDGDERIGG
jgi:PAS domain S-box-containing protein